MTTEERLAKVERELAEAKAEATRVKRRSRWLLAALGVGLGALALVWASAASVPKAEAQGAAGPTSQVIERQRITANVQELLSQAERLQTKAERPEDYDQALRPLAEADRLIDLARVLMPEEVEGLREQILVLRSQISKQRAEAEAARKSRAEIAAQKAEGERIAQYERDRQQKIQQLWDRAKELRRSMQFPEAIEVLDRLIAIDPENERARLWRDDRMYLESQVRQTEIRSEETPAVEQTRARLQEKMDMDFEHTSLDIVLKYIAEVKRLNIVIDPDMAAQGIDLAMRVLDLKVKGVSVESVLDTILGADLGYKVKAGYILVTTRKKLQQNLPAVTHPVAAGAAVNEVRANAFILEDERGMVRAVLQAAKFGPVLRLYDAAGKPRAALSVDADGPMLTLLDENGTGRVVLDMDKGGAGLDLFDVAGKPRAILSVVNERGPVLVLNDAAGKPRAALKVDKDRPGLDLFDAAGKAVWRAP